MVVNDVPMKYIQLIVCHAVENLLQCEYIDKVSSRVNHESSMRIAWLVINFSCIYTKLFIRNQNNNEKKKRNEIESKKRDENLIISCSFENMHM